MYTTTFQGGGEGTQHMLSRLLVQNTADGLQPPTSGAGKLKVVVKQLKQTWFYRTSK